MARFVPQTRRDRIMVALLIGAFAEILWCIYLGVVLPPHYVAEHWALAWIGLDVAEISMLFAAAWAAWRQRALIILFTVAGATLFLLDAWFDVTTAHHGDISQSIVLAVCLEVPSALALLWVAYRAMVRFVESHAGLDLRASPLHRLPLTRQEVLEVSDDAVLRPEGDA